jgi:hypothetical protein
MNEFVYLIIYHYICTVDNLKKFYEQEKSKLESYIEYNQNRDKSLYSFEEISKFNSYVSHSSQWLEKIKRLIDGDYIFDNK